MSSPPDEGSLPSILIVDDDADLRELLARALRGEETRHIEQAASAAAAKASLLRRSFDVVVTDLSMPDEGGLSLMQWAQAHCPRPSWIVLTGYGTFDTAVKALQLGAFDFLSKPLKRLESLRNSVRNALAQQRLLAERDRLHAELTESNERLREHVAQLEEACHLLREQADTIRADLQRAGIIQQALLPQVAPRIDRFRIHALYRPSHNVGGDLYDVVRLDAHRVGLVIADAAGHGLAAAMLAVLFRTQLHLVDPDSRLPRRPCDVLYEANRALCEAFPAPGLFLTAAYGLLDTQTSEVTVASAGHPALLLQRQGGGIESILHTGPALGLYPDARFAQQEIVLESGDRLLLHTDGLYDGFSGDATAPIDKLAEALREEDEAGVPLLRRLLERTGARPADDGEDPEDDITLLMLDASPGPSALDNGTPKPFTAASVALPRKEFQILTGTEERRTFVSLQGRADWARSAAFHEVCVDAIEQRRDLLLDLALCDHLDSTFLGTIHELCQRAEKAGVELRLQAVMPPVEELFRELGMELVLEHVVSPMLPLPTRMQSLGDGDRDRAPQALRMLRAHEVLAALNARNRQEFDPLLEALRREIAASSG